MLQKILSQYNGSVTVNGVSLSDFDFKSTSDALTIHLSPKSVKSLNASSTQSQRHSVDADSEVVYKIKVRQYMTKKASPEFDFMKKYNNDVPMPLRVMVGTKIKETRGMIYMKLHGDILAERTRQCMCCGRTITNPVSQFFGMGPECGGHNYVNPFDSDEELRAAVDAYRLQLQSMTWEGWIIKSAIESEEILQNA